MQCGTIYLGSIQLLTSVVLIVWTCVTSFCVLKVIDMTLGLRISAEEEMLGSDLVEHGITCTNYRYDKTTKAIIRLQCPPERYLVTTSTGHIKVVVEGDTVNTANTEVHPTVTTVPDDPTNRLLSVSNGGVKRTHRRRVFMSGFFKRGVFKSKHHVKISREPEVVELTNEINASNALNIEDNATETAHPDTRGRSSDKSDSETVFIDQDSLSEEPV